MFKKEEALSFVLLAETCLAAIRAFDKSDPATFGFLLALYTEQRAGRS